MNNYEPIIQLKQQNFAVKSLGATLHIHECVYLTSPTPELTTVLGLVSIIPMHFM